MKSKLLAIGFAITALPVFAQQHFSAVFNKSAFSGYHSLKPSARDNGARLQQKVQQHFPGMKYGIDKLTGGLTDLFGVAIPLPGNTLEAKLAQCFSSHLADFGVNAGEWQQTRSFEAGHATFVSYEQYFAGRKVVFSRLQFRFTSDGRLERVKLKTYGQPGSLAPAITAEQAKAAAAQDLTGASITENNAGDNWLWFPVPSAQGYTLRPAYAFNIKGQTEQLPFDLTGYVDAITGDVLYRSNRVKETLDLTVKGTVYKQNPLLPATDEPLANLLINVTGSSSNFYTDSLGFFEDAQLLAPAVATIKLQGKWSKVNLGSPAVTPSATHLIATNGTTYMFPAATPSDARAVNAYYHVNRVHDFMKGYFPTFTMMDNDLATNVDINTTSTNNCKAYYNGSSINFYAPYGSCNSFAQCGDIIYHEYGHGISDRFYDWIGGNGMINGGLNEGNSDIWGIGITHDPVVGKGAFVNNGVIRRYDLAPKVYPQDLVGEVHADGEIIAGAWWDVAVNTGNVPLMSDLFAKTYFDTPDGPDGTEGEVYHDVLIAALLNDDNDNDLTNGTPNFTPIVAAFARHGIYLLGDAVIEHEEVANQPANTPVTLNATVALSAPAFLGDVKLFYRPRGTGSWDSTVMTAQGGLSFTAQIPGKPEGTLIDYYFAVYDNMGTAFANAFAPAGYAPNVSGLQVNIPYQFGIGLGKVTGFDFETPVSGWTIGNAAGDNASAGIWLQAKPIGSFVSSVVGQIPVQPNFDKTLGVGQTGQCLVTANAPTTFSQVGTADVDGGKTTVLTPVWDLSAYEQPVIEYYRWYTNDKGSNPGTDTWLVQIKDAAGSLWIQSVDKTRVSDNSWRRRIFSVNEFLPASTNVVMRFVAEDISPGSAVEAAIDDIFIYDKASSPLGIDDKAGIAKAAIYPNPASDQVHISFASVTNGMIGIYDLSGKEVMQQVANGKKEYTVTTTGIAAGTYFLMINTGKTIQTHKLVIMH